MVPNDLRYTRDHEWVRIEGDKAVIGITDYAQSELGDIIFIEFPSIGDKFVQNDVSGTIEAVKTVADIYSPLSGEVVDINSELESNPEYVNSDPYKKGWLIKIKIDNNSEDKPLLDSNQYSGIIS
jgi:glycine cleavage system H protein